MITEVILYDNKYADLCATVKSIAESGKDVLSKVQVLVCNSTEGKMDSVILSELSCTKEELKLNLSYFSGQYREIISKLQDMGTDYVHFVQYSLYRSRRF